MGDLLKKGFLLGLGAAISGKEKLEKKLNELVEDKELTPDQAKQVLHNFIEKGELKKEEWSAKQAEQTQKMGRDLGFATKDELTALEERIHAIESKLADE